jgi:hypothetical protein
MARKYMLNYACLDTDCKVRYGERTGPITTESDKTSTAKLGKRTKHEG